MDEAGVDKLSDKKVLIVIGGFFGILALLTIAFFFLSSLKKNSIPGSPGLFTSRESGGKEGSIGARPSIAPVPTFPPPPTLTTARWTMSLRTQPTTILASQRYVLKQNYSIQEIRTFVKKLFTPATVTTSKNQVVAYTINPSTKDTEVVRFNPQSGAFSFITTKGIPLTPQTGNTISNESIYAFLRSINLYDDTIQVTAQYENSTMPDLKYIELHRDWRRTGLPVLNFAGMLNVPENQNLATFSLASAQGSIPDANIIKATDGKNGLARARDFNTMTIVVDPASNEVIAMDSNIRIFDETKTKIRNLISYAEAEAKLKNNGYEMVFTSPSGAGTVDWKKVYPGNKADTSNVVITDAIYAYLEQSPFVAQSEIKPYVLFRGYATLESGYRISVLAAVPADRSAVLGTSTGEKLVVQAPEQRNLNQPTPNPTHTIPIPSVAQACYNDPYYKIGPFDAAVTFMGITMAHTPFVDEIDAETNQTYHNTNDGHGFWFYIPPANFNAEVLAADLQKITDNLIAFQGVVGYNGGESFRNQGVGWDTIWNDVNHTWGDNRVNYDWNHRCPIRLTGGSPTLIIYGKPNQTLTIQPSSRIIYADPPLLSNQWEVKVNDDLTVNTYMRPYIYYEYKKIQFNRPKKGWIVDRTNFVSIITSEIAEKLALNDRELERLLFEIYNAALTVDSDKFFIGLIDQQELDSKLPIGIDPAPILYRYHFYVGRTKGNVEAPQLNPIKRSEYMVIELGSYAEEN